MTFREHFDNAVQDAMYGTAAAVVVNGALEHFQSIGWTALSALVGATAVGLARIAVVRWGPGWAQKDGRSSRAPDKGRQEERRD